MPYLMHSKSEPVESGTLYASRSEAYEALAAHGALTHTVTFQPSTVEAYTWLMREHGRFISGDYKNVPWIQYQSMWEPCDTMTVDQYGCPPETLFHFAHLSNKNPGMVAYTPTDEHGIADRQIVVKPGKYLETFYKDRYSTRQIATFVDSVKAYGQSFKVATSTEEIVGIYTAESCPSSCMAHPVDHFDSSIHPCAVYGESDLGVAYLGSIATGRISARCVVWPSEKVYTRVYGDSCLSEMLRDAGWHHGDLSGAKIRAIRDGGSWVMPYVDGAEGATLDRGVGGKRHFTLTDDDSDEWNVKETNGHTSENETNTCEHCSERCPNDQQYCEDCENDSSTCESCNERVWDDGRMVHDSFYCDSCAEEQATTCESCNDTWHEEDLRSRSQLDTDDPLQSYCSSCRGHHASCSECGEVFDTDDHESDHGTCEDCEPEVEEEETEDTDTPTVEISIPEALQAVPVAILPTPTIPTDVYLRFNTDGTPAEWIGPVPVATLIGALAVHRATDYKGRTGTNWTITHVPTGLVAGHAETFGQAVARASMLTTPGMDWNFDDSCAIPTATRDHARAVRDGLFTFGSLLGVGVSAVCHV